MQQVSSYTRFPPYAAFLGREEHVRPRNHNIVLRELRQQSIPSRCRRVRVDIEDHRHFGVLQLDALCMDSVAPE
jgi:hypothetical protein